MILKKKNFKAQTCLLPKTPDDQYIKVDSRVMGMLCFVFNSV